MYQNIYICENSYIFFNKVPFHVHSFVKYMSKNALYDISAVCISYELQHRTTTIHTLQLKYGYKL